MVCGQLPAQYRLCIAIGLGRIQQRDARFSSKVQYPAHLLFRHLPGLIGNSVGQSELNRAQTKLRTMFHAANSEAKALN